jgi:N-acetylglucosaminyldiphosphoundecaprenol N-acetyl-beta-D-mannosaminyltransferase
MSHNTFRLLGVNINPLAIEDLNETVGKIIATKQKEIIASRNLHGIYLYHKDERMRQFSDIASYMRIDGMPIIFLGKLLGFPLQRRHRVTYVDWIRPLVKEASNNGWKIFYLGSKPGIAAKGFDVLKNEFPDLIAETSDGYFKKNKSSPENQAVLKKISEYEPDILMVGMGMPRQEHWILDNFDDIEANAILTCGACIDYIAGEIPTPPRWIARLGFEWLARLLSEPKRLWNRYLIEPWFLLSLAIQDILNCYVWRKP